MRGYGALSEAFTRSGWCVYHEKPPPIIQSCIGDYVEDVPLFNGQLWHELQCRSLISCWSKALIRRSSSVLSCMMLGKPNCCVFRPCLLSIRSMCFSASCLLAWADIEIEKSKDMFDPNCSQRSGAGAPWRIRITNNRRSSFGVEN